MLTDTALWVFRAYRAHGFRPIYWPANLDTWLERLKADLTPDTFAACAPFYRWLVVNIPAFTLLTDDAPGVAERPDPNALHREKRP